MKYSFLLLSILFSQLLTAQNKEQSFGQKLSEWKIKPILGVQIWSIYTVGAEVYDQDSLRFEEVDDRFNFQLHRSRIGVKGQPYPNLAFNITTAFDFVGQDVLSGTEQPGNNGPSPILRLWNATVQWKLGVKSDALNLTAGYFVPQIGRESITPALRSTSFEKSWSQNYLRRHLVGKGPGRTAGLNLGGLMPVEKNFEFGYDFGIFNPTYFFAGGNSVGKKYSPLFIGRIVGHFGDPEMESYSLGHKINYFGKRNGFSLGISGARQGATDLFSQNTALGADFLLNWENINLDGDWTFLWRKQEEQNGQTNTINGGTGYIRLSVNFERKNGAVFEPVIMQMLFNGETEAEDQVIARALGSPSGEERILNFGFNYYFNPDLKLSLFYTLRNADSGELSETLGVNNYFIQNGVGPIRRGDMLGLGLVAIL